MSTASGRKPWAMVGGSVLAVIVLYALWRLAFATGSVQSTNDAFVSANYTLIAPKGTGFVDEVLVRDNQAVKAGQLLARIDPQNCQAAVQAAQASAR